MEEFLKKEKEYNLFEENNNTNNSFISKTLTNIQQNTPFSIRFFSNQNLDKIQEKIIMRVASETNYKISRQDDMQVQIIQRSIYLTHQQKIQNQYANFENSMNMLNDYVVEEAVKKIIPEIKQYFHYINDITQGRNHMTLPQSVNNKQQLTHPYLG